MTDIDQLSRAVKDLEYRVRALEKGKDERLFTWDKLRAWGKPPSDMGAVRNGGTVHGWCECGRDICRAPDCPSHAKHDPLGR